MKYLIAGLGNPGSEYLFTRHNIGFMVLDRLAASQSLSFTTERYGELATLSHRGRKLILLKPSTYMNLSGKAVRYWLQQEKIPIENLLVITDDIALPFGKLRLRTQGSHGGHNGLRNIEELLQTSQYARLRIGIGNEFAKGQQADYVLSPFSEEEQKQLPTILDKAAQAVLSFANVGAVQTMNQFNR
jgi:PTH1 family peptidyl-tRNA hydrolase